MGRYNENWKRAYSKLAEEFFELQAEYDALNEELQATKTTTLTRCGHSFIADSLGSVEVVGKYIVNVTKEIEENTNGS